MLRDRRVLGALVVVIVVLAAGFTTLLLRDDSSRSDADRPVATPSPSESGSHDHEHDLVDEVDPEIDPADYVTFCDAFYLFANAYSTAVADGNDTSGSTGLQSAADDFRAAAADTELTDEVRAGFEWFVDDALRVENDATTEEQGAFSTFLNSACPA